MNARSLFRRAYVLLGWFVGVIFGLFVILVLCRIPIVFGQQKTQEMVANIHAGHLNVSDVNGINLPQQPDQVQNNTKLAGIDANANGIRDDAELFIFKLHPLNTKSVSFSYRIRAAELQYAKALQRYLTSVTNSETLVAVIQEDERGSFCIHDALRSTVFKDRLNNDVAWNDYFSTSTAQIKQIDQLVFNTKQRKDKYNEVFAKYMTSYGSLGNTNCDLSI